VSGAPGRVPLFWVDAFSDGPFGGNPAAVCLLEGPAPEPAMQALAFELGLSETAYVWPDGDELSLRWFTPAAEVELCGHATVAAAHALRGAGWVDGTVPVRFRTRSGVLSAAFAPEDLVVLDLPADPPRPVEAPPALARRWPVRSAATGRTDLVLELPDADAVRHVCPTAGEIGALGFRGVMVTAPGGGGDGGDGGGVVDYVLRFFAPRVGVPEDPVTGSAQCVLGPFWAERLGRHELEARQLSRRGGALHVTVGAERVGVGGRAVTILEGAVAGRAARRLLGDRR
jgi:predicted PhzF superfamily epimerase YddE/YHI9